MVTRRRAGLRSQGMHEFRIVDQLDHRQSDVTNVNARQADHGPAATIGAASVIPSWSPIVGPPAKVTLPTSNARQGDHGPAPNPKPGHTQFSASGRTGLSSGGSPLAHQDVIPVNATVPLSGC